MTNRAPLLLTVMMSFVTLGCLQKLDPNASDGVTSVQVDPDGGIGAPFPIKLDTPVIAVTSDPVTGDPVGDTTADPCVKTKADSLAIRKVACQICHEGSGVPGAPLTFILEDDMLINKLATQTSFPGWKYVVPGDPENSLIYHRVAVTEDMPKAASDIQSTTLQVSISQMSVLRAWIMCLGAPPAGTAAGTGGTTGATSAGGTTGATGAGGRTGAGGATGAGGRTGAGGATGAGGTTTASGAGGSTGAGGATTAMGGTTGTGADGGVATACTGIQGCQAPTQVASLPFNTTINGGAICYEVDQTVTAINCTNANGRQIRVNNTQFAIANGTCNGTVPAARNGGYCVQVNVNGQGQGQAGATTLNII